MSGGRPDSSALGIGKAITIHTVVGTS